MSSPESNCPKAKTVIDQFTALQDNGLGEVRTVGRNVIFHKKHHAVLTTISYCSMGPAWSPTETNMGIVAPNQRKIKKKSMISLKIRVVVWCKELFAWLNDCWCVLVFAGAYCIIQLVLFLLFFT